MATQNKDLSLPLILKASSSGRGKQKSTDRDIRFESLTLFQLTTKFLISMS